MKKTGRTVLINILLLLSIFGILVIAHAWLIAGPSRAYEDQDLRYVTEFMEGEDYDEARMLSRFSFDTVYYVIEAKKDNVITIVWFDHKFKSEGEHELVTFEPVYPLADTYGVSYEDISFGVYENQLIYVLKRPDFYELFVSVDSLEILLHIGGAY